MFKISEVVFGLLDHNMWEKVDRVFHSLRVGISDVQTEISSRVDFHDFELYTLLFASAEQLLVKWLHFDCSFLFYIIRSNYRDLIVFLNGFFSVDDGVYEMIFDKIFPTTFISIVLLLVGIINIGQNSRLEGLVLMAFIKNKLKFWRRWDYLFYCETILKGRS